MKSDPNTEYKINSHNTAVLHDDTLAVTLGDPAEYAQYIRSVRGGRRALDVAESVFAGILFLGLLGVGVTAVWGLITWIAGDFSSVDKVFVFVTCLGICFGVSAFGLLFAYVCDLLSRPSTRRIEESTVLTLPLGERRDDERKVAAIRFALAERVTVEARNQLQDMVAEGRKDAAEGTLWEMLRSCAQTWESEGAAQSKALTALMNER